MVTLDEKEAAFALWAVGVLWKNGAIRDREAGEIASRLEAKIVKAFEEAQKKSGRPPIVEPS